MNEIYELALTQMKYWTHKKEVAIQNALRYVLHKKTEEEKKEIFGDEIYFEYQCYKRDLENKKYKNFLSVFKSGLSNFHFDSDKSREEFLEINIKLSKDFKEDLVLAKIAEEYFTPRSLEAYLNSRGII